MRSLQSHEYEFLYVLKVTYFKLVHFMTPEKAVRAKHG